MPKAQNLKVRDGDVLVLAGTMKGLFVLRSNGQRGKWELGGPYFPGASIYSLAYDDRGRRRVWAGVKSWHWGAVLSHTDDFGAHWSEPTAAPVRFPEDTKLALNNIWQIVPGRAVEPEVLFCGVEPANLFESRDAGASWQLVRGLYENPHRAKWQPGFGGLCLHTILPHPNDRDRMIVAVSAAGVYRTENGGRTWKASNTGIRAEFLPDKHPEFGQCVHKVVRHPAAPERLFLQNHWGLYRSDDDGRTWKDIAKGVPSDFGFCMAIHPTDPETVFIVPIESDGFRCTPEGKLRVYRTRNGGKSWEPMTRGLPQEHAYETILRDALCTDPLKPAGVYFGTKSGKLFGSRNDGKSWEQLIDGLPPVTCVRTAFVAPARDGIARKRITKKLARKSVKAKSKRR